MSQRKLMILSNRRLYLCMEWQITNFSFRLKRLISFCSFTRMAQNAQMILLIFLILFGVLFNQLKTWLQEDYKVLFLRMKKNYKNIVLTAFCSQSEEIRWKNKCKQEIRGTSTCYLCGTVKIQELRSKPRLWPRDTLLMIICNKPKIQV